MARLLTLMSALMAAIGAGWLVMTQLSSGPANPEAAEAVQTSEVLVAELPIARGTPLGPGNMGWQIWPDAAISPGMILRKNTPDAIAAHTDWISRIAMLSGEPFRLDRLSDGSAGLLSLVLTPGMRAVAVRISAETSAGGFILPDDRVDVIHTVQDDLDDDGDDEPVSLTIMHNVRVLAVDQMTEQTDGEVTKVGETVTLELLPRQVELLTTARNSGRISLSLLSVADFGDTRTGNLAMLLPDALAIPGSSHIAPDDADGGESVQGQWPPQQQSEAEPGWFAGMFGRGADRQEQPTGEASTVGSPALAEGSDAITEVSPDDYPAPTVETAQPPEPLEVTVIASGVSKTVFVETVQ